MTLQQLRYVIQAADSRSMNEAAKQLYISQPSLSGAIKDLEEEIGTEIFKRTNKGTVLTPEGEEFLGYARQVAEQYQLLEERKEKIQCFHAALHLCSESICGAGETVWHG